MPSPAGRSFPYKPRRGTFVGRTFGTDRQYRDALAKLLDFSSWEEQRRAPRVVDGLRDILRLHPAEQLARRQALEALAYMRSGLSLEGASREAGTTSDAVIRHTGAALTRDAAGRYHAATADRLYRPLRVLTTEGELEIDTRSSRVATLIAEHNNAVGYFLRTGDTTGLARFVGKKVQGHELETRPEVIEERGRRGELTFEDLYRG